MDDRVKWNELHASQQEQAAPSVFLKQLFELKPWRIQPGKALDIAAGKGRNALFLAEEGFSVEAIDISEVGLQEARRRAEEKGLTITFRQADLDKAELPEASYDLILNINFLQRFLIPKMKRALKVGGYIIFDTYLGVVGGGLGVVVGVIVGGGLGFVGGVRAATQGSSERNMLIGAVVGAIVGNPEISKSGAVYLFSPE